MANLACMEIRIRVVVIRRDRNWPPRRSRRPERQDHDTLNLGEVVKKMINFLENEPIRSSGPAPAGARRGRAAGCETRPGGMTAADVPEKEPRRSASARPRSPGAEALRCRSCPHP